MLVLGTHNRKKAAELSDLLGPLGFRLQTLADLPGAMEVDESGNTFADNARLKATLQARHLGQWVLGEDSGLSVDALGGAPGVFSARFAGPSASDEANNRYLLEKLADTPLARRTAHYTCHITLADPAGEVRVDVEAVCRGRIRTAPAGSAGFGYDPLFEIPEYHRTFGQLGDVVKSVVSHRSRAIQLLVPRLAALVQAGQWESASP